MCQYSSTFSFTCLQAYCQSFLLAYYPILSFVLVLNGYLFRREYSQVLFSSFLLWTLPRASDQLLLTLFLFFLLKVNFNTSYQFFKAFSILFDISDLTSFAFSASKTPVRITYLILLMVYSARVLNSALD